MYSSLARRDFLKQSAATIAVASSGSPMGGAQSIKTKREFNAYQQNRPASLLNRTRRHWYRADHGKRRGRGERQYKSASVFPVVDLCVPISLGSI
jgi:hypothetical protein